MYFSENEDISYIYPPSNVKLCNETQTLNLVDLESFKLMMHTFPECAILLSTGTAQASLQVFLLKFFCTSFHGYVLET